MVQIRSQPLEFRQMKGWSLGRTHECETREIRARPLTSTLVPGGSGPENCRAGSVAAEAHVDFCPRLNSNNRMMPLSELVSAH